MKKFTASSIALLSAILFFATSTHALNVSKLPKDSSTISLRTHTADEIKIEKLKHELNIISLGNCDAANSSVSHEDSIKRLVDLFFYDQYHHFQDPLAPYFMLMSKDAKLGLGIGGAVRLRGWCDFGGSIPANGFVPYLIPVPANPEYRRTLKGTPGGTALFLRIIGRNPILGDIIGFVQTDFSALDNTLKLKKAYVSISDWTIGYTLTAFNDPAAEAPTIDGAGQCGTAGNSALEIRWDHDFRKPWSIGASVAMPTTHVQANNVTTKALTDWFPDFAAYGSFRLPHNGHVRLAGMLRVIPYRNLITRKNHSKAGWGVQLSSVVYPIPRLAIYAEANTGRGYSSYMGDLQIGQYDLINDPDKEGNMYAPWSMGLNLGCKYNFRHNVYACMALAEARYFDKRGSAPDEYKYGLYGSWSIFWEPTTRMQLGAEYLHGRRTNMNHAHGSANRADILFQFSF
ncbi:MAG: hypothetical protein K2M87_05695 [Muribaculaceae bacterium]|nr:hypothetical protein [Muribaculaceae bacterium]